ncbi:NADP-dependent oxidoreductase, L4BD family [Hyphomonas neptunium ATCC 15444]|uniref:NADP-dependent oxidoreductase, L4BD family n=2 Tax=Hyphomonas TaxID=85 RepID=Q0C385_HYPNA|nr:MULTISPECIES: NADP-dependent oxidoreductase [Hyphomonas]ABI76523.1 NADP-dependent oxidoreductase, L4BD family [Hyphomonas neptunium ATCC 15444]KCZ95957.1 L4BD family NADP-dependent oxidoreductase [Hyphomonas hirschiana VP5]
MKLYTLKTEIDAVPVADDFIAIEAPRPDCPDGGIVARVIYLSLDPYVGSRLRGRHMGEAPPKPMEGAIPGAIVGQVVKSRAAGVSEGDFVHAMEGGWQEFAAIPAGHFRKLDPKSAPLRAHIGVLGMPGLTAWAGITQLAKVMAGDVVLIDAAAGAVGGTAGQIARIKGASKAVGIAGGPEKCRLVTETYGFDACIDYKAEGWQAALKEALPEGASVFFENVSAEMAMTALSVSQTYVRGVLCGLADAYQSSGPAPHALNAGAIIGKRAQLRGLVVYDFYSRWDEYAAEAAAWIRDGKLAFAEDHADGLDQAPALFAKLMRGANVGKPIITVSEEQA